MRLLALMVAAVLWGAPALAESKAAPDGFGPIKFGMTKEEAWAAIGGEGEWSEDGRSLKYEMGIPKSAPLLGRPLKVSHLFHERYENLAGPVLVEYEGVAYEETICYQDIAYIVVQIRDIYGANPISLSEFPKLNYLKQYYYYEIFAFSTGVGSSITVEASIGPGSLGAVPICKVAITYDPPTLSELPF